MKKFAKKSRYIAAGLIVVILSFGFIKVSDRDFELVKSLDIFYSLFREVNLFYVDQTNPEKLVKTGIDAMLNSLDPYTTFIPESEKEDFNFMTTGNYGGIGAIIRQSNGYAIIADPYEGSPAAKAGLRGGDVIISVDGLNTKGKNLSTVSEKLKGTPGTEVVLEVKKPEVNDTHKVKINREQIHVNTVPYYGKLDDNTGYIRLSNFTLGAAKEVQDAFVDLKENKGIDNLILDLRGNPGGLLIEAVRICNLFVDKGQLIVSTKGKVKQWDQDYYTTAEPLDTKIPIVVLVNRGSASASEIVTGALQDLDRAVIVGERTFGKGLVQTTRKLKYDAQLKVTTAKYYIPSGRCIQALDYAHRHDDGSVGHIPDSLISKFSTKNGRTVYDGGGILPDVIDSMETLSQIALNLYMQNIIFDYVTNYMVKHQVAPPENGFRLTDAEYTNFEQFVQNRDFTYETRSEDALDKLITTAKREKYYGLAADQFEALSEKLQHNNLKDLETFKDEIVELIEEEIMGRYYYQSGRVKASIPSDNQINKALGVINNPEEYNTIIKPSKKMADMPEVTELSTTGIGRENQ
ncbi:MAG TPA: S41 family peptidase [Bacteroidales bacterium]|nr:S41 family peptidase [Bacteroidales bacterium]